MKQFPFFTLIAILLVTAAAIWLDLPNHPGIQFGDSRREIETRLGLDLIGGTQTMLEADLPADATIVGDLMDDTVKIVENRVNGLGLSESLVQRAGDRRIVVELPGVEDPQEALATIRGTALLEFVDFSNISVVEAASLVGQRVQTDFRDSSADAMADEPPAGPVFHTVMTGADLRSAAAVADSLGQVVVQFQLTEGGAQTFRQFTGSHVGSILAIVIDKVVISIPEIQSEIRDGEGQILGNFTPEEANNLAIQLQYGALPIPLKVVETRSVGPTLGQDSLRKSLVAGAIGLAIVMLFMMLYYRLPGVVANLSILIYATIAFALFRTIPVTLTLAGIAGLMLSTGSALDANILIFERLKEELRAGRSVRSALDIGWRRAWPSIRDSNTATLITCVILFWFGSSFGATIVKGFALTLFIGVVVSLFTAITVTRTLLMAALSIHVPQNQERWFGI